MVKRLIITPIPRPVTIMLREINPLLVVAVMRESRNIAMVETRKMLFLKRRGLIIGSAARNSIKMKATSITAEKMNRPIICQEFQAYCVPAQEKASNKGTAKAIRAAAPE